MLYKQKQRAAKIVSNTEPQVIKGKPFEDLAKLYAVREEDMVKLLKYFMEQQMDCVILEERKIVSKLYVYSQERLRLLQQKP